MTDGPPDAGPSGYLPERAARRARKVVLRAPLGVGWIVGAVLAGTVLIVAAVVFLLRAGDPPGHPFVEVGPLEAVGAASYDDDRGVLLVGAAGRIRTFAVDPGDVPVFCVASGNLESPSGRVWTVTGRALDGGASLDQHPTVVHRGTVYVDLTRQVAGPTPSDTGARPACA